MKRKKADMRTPPTLTALFARAGLCRSMPVRPVWLAMWVLLFTLAVAPLIPGKGLDPLTNSWIGVSISVLAAAVCWMAIPTAGVRRCEIALLAAGVSAYAAGDVMYTLLTGHNVEGPFPSVADVGYLLFYPLILGSLIVAARRELRRVDAPVWLDSALVALAAACGVGLLLRPVFNGATRGPLAQAVALSFPLFDMLLIATAVGIAALGGWKLRSSWMWPLAGLTVFAAADVFYVLQLAFDNYQLARVMDILWSLGVALLAVWAHSTIPAARDHENRAVLAGPALATAVSVLVLIVASRTRVPVIVVVLAGVALLAAAARTQVAFRQLHRVSDLRRQATTDELTGLPNRRALYSGVTAALSGPARPRALLLLDLDRFKQVNDSMGHHVGDQLLVQAARRLSEQLRHDDLLARLGGDEFAVLLGAADEAQAVAVAVRLRAALATPFTLEGIAVQAGVSIGIALSPEHGRDVTSLLRRADMAMYKAKNSRDGHRVYDSADDTHGHERLRTLQELRAALAEDQLILHFQPKLDLSTGDIPGVEALVRWNHPTRGLLYPDSFLGLVEDAGLMQAMTRRVLERALDQASRWKAQGRLLSVAVNLSASSLLDGNFPEYVAAELAARQLPALALQLEITEQTLMADRARARVILSRLREMGVQIALDDFGTGYSSLAYLRELPIDELKLDRSFVFPMADDARAAALVESTIRLAHSLGLRMVAEGVEDDATYRELSRYDCDQIQGFYVCQPLPAADLDDWLCQREALADQRQVSGPALPRAGRAGLAASALGR